MLAAHCLVPGLSLLVRELKEQLQSAFAQQPRPSRPEPAAAGNSGYSLWAGSQLPLSGLQFQTSTWYAARGRELERNGLACAARREPNWPHRSPFGSHLPHSGQKQTLAYLTRAKPVCGWHYYLLISEMKKSTAGHRASRCGKAKIPVRALLQTTCS